MSQSWDIDPKIGDYIMVGGQPQETDSLTVPAYVRLKAPRLGLRKRNGEPGGWMYAPDNRWGSGFEALKGTRVSSRDTTTVESTAAIALQPIADNRRARSITVNALVFARGAVGLQADILDNGGQQDQLKLQGLGI